jgi:hypothetical protein
MDVAIESEAFGKPGKRIYIEEIHFHPADLLALVIIGGFTIPSYGSLTQEDLGQVYRGGEDHLAVDDSRKWFSWIGTIARIRGIRRITSHSLKRHDFEAGSIGPKVEACIDFVEITRSRAAIGSLDDALPILEGKVGAQIMAGTFEMEFYEQ